MMKNGRWRWVAVLFCFVHCHDPSGVGREPDEYVGCATDENWVTFDDNEPLAIVSPADAPVFTAPSAGATIPFANPPVFAWDLSMTEVGRRDGNVPHEPGPECMNCCEQFNMGGLSTLHEPPISGDVYDLHFSIDGELKHRALTTLQEWAPTAALWASFRGKTVSLAIWRMSLLKNDVKTGPFTSGTPLVFTVGS